MCGCEGREHRTSSCYLCRALEPVVVEADTDGDDS